MQALLEHARAVDPMPHANIATTKATQTTSEWLPARLRIDRVSGRDVAESALRGPDRTVDIRHVGLPVADRHSHAALPAPRRASEVRCAACHDLGDRRVGSAIVILLRGAGSWIEKAHKTLVDRGLPNHLGSW